MVRVNMKTPAFTLFESVVAITIISLLIGIGSMIYGNLVQAERPISYYQAKEEIDQLLMDLKQNKNYFNQNFEFDSYNIEQKVTFHLGNKKLYQIEYVVSSQGKEYWSENHLISNSQHDY